MRNLVFELDNKPGDPNFSDIISRFNSCSLNRYIVVKSTTLTKIQL